MPEKSPFSKLEHIGIIVKDLSKAVAYYESLGFGPFRRHQNIEFLERQVLGRVIDPASIKLDARVAKVGPVFLELIQPVEGESLWKDFLETHGEGINHLGFASQNVFEEAAELTAGGARILYSAKYRAGGAAFYFDTAKTGGVLFELVQWATGIP